MTKRIDLLFVLLVAMLLLAGLRQSSAPVSANASRFVVGQVYTFAWDCLPSAVMGDQNPCYYEVLLVKAIHDDGWLDVEDARPLPEGFRPERWTVNPARAVGYTFDAAHTRQAMLIP